MSFFDNNLEEQSTTEFVHLSLKSMKAVRSQSEATDVSSKIVIKLKSPGFLICNY